MQSYCMSARNAYVEFLLEQFEALGAISSRSMFGGHCLYCDGVPFGLVANNALFLKADDVNRPAFESRSLKAFRPFEDQPGTMSYYEAPPEIFENPEAMREWCGGSVEAGKRAQIKKKPKKKGAKA